VPSGGAAPDRVEESRATGTPQGLKEALTALLGEAKVLSGISDLVRYASDASPYRFVPQAVVLPDSVQDIVRLLAYARRERRNLVFRAAGTSLNGQAQGEDILVDVRRHFSGIEVEGRRGAGPRPARDRTRPGDTRRWPGTAGCSAPTRRARWPARSAESSPTTRPGRRRAPPVPPTAR